MKEIIKKIAKENDSFYLYDEKKILKNIKTLKENFPKIHFLYSLKTNPNPNVLDTIYHEEIGADAASLGEVILSRKHGLKKKDIQYSAPGKSKNDIKNAYSKSTIIADSFHEIDMIEEVSKKEGKKIKIGVRLNPNFSYTTDTGSSGKFGIDEEVFLEKIDELKKKENIKIIGIHVHLKSQELITENLESHYEKMFNLAEKINEKLDGKLEFVNMGSGIGIPYELADKDVNIQELGKKTTELIESKESLKKVDFYIETGRFLVGKAGTYVTKVRDKKVSRGKTFIILNNTLNGFYRPSINRLVEVYTKDENPTPQEPLFTSRNSTQISPLDERNEKEKVTIMGNLCTGTDIIANNIDFPKLEIGDIITMTNAGSYSYVLSPMQFASMEKPKEFLVKKDGKILK